MPRFVPPLLLALLFALLPTVSRGQALNPFESFDDNLKQLKDRLRFYSSNYTRVAIPDDLKPDKLAELAAQGALSQQAVRKLRALTEMLDRVVLGTVKREIYSTGQSVKGDPTSHSNYAVRSTLLMEFGAIVRRQKLHFASYFPKGDGYLQRLRVETDLSYKMVDEMLTHLVTLLRDEMEKQAAGGGGGLSGSGGGVIESVSAGGGEGGGLSGFDDRPPSAAPGSVHRSQPLPVEREIPWFFWLRVITTVGLVIVIVGSLAALLLPRVRKGMLAVLTTFGFGRLGTSVVEEDHYKRAITLATRGDFRRALASLSKVKDPARQNDVAYYRAMCHVRLLETADATTLLSSLNLTTLGSDELFRLAQSCEETGLNDWGIKLYEVVAGRDIHFRNVMSKLARLKEKAAEPAKPAGPGR